MDFENAVKRVAQFTDTQDDDLGWAIRIAVTEVVGELGYQGLLDVAKDPKVYCGEVLMALIYHVQRALFDETERRISYIPGYYKNPWPIEADNG